MSEPIQVIVRAFDDEPVAVFAIGVQSNAKHINVSGSIPPPSYIGWPITDAFDYSEDDLAALKTAYSNSDKRELGRLYGEMRTRPRVYLNALLAANSED